MNSEIFSWLIIAEIALPLLILSIVLAWVLLSNYKKNKEAARNLILKIKNNEDNEKQALLSFLTDKIALDEDKAKKTCKKIINERKFLFRNLISGLLDKNLEAIAALESDMSRITRHYHQLEIQAATSSESEETADEAELESIDQLKQEVKSLKHEIHITLTTLNNIFAEFSSMFGEEVPETEMSVDQIITAMESFSNKGGEASSDDETDELGAIDEVDDEPDAFAEVEDALDDIAAEDSETSSEGDETSDAPPIHSEEVEAEEVGSTEETPVEETTVAETTEVKESQESLDFSLDDELDDIDSALDELELGATSEDDDPSWDEAFEESGDKPSDN